MTKDGAARRQIRIHGSWQTPCYMALSSDVMAWLDERRNPIGKEGQTGGKATLR
jgi:hypothetical protein